MCLLESWQIKLFYFTEIVNKWDKTYYNTLINHPIGDKDMANEYINNKDLFLQKIKDPKLINVKTNLPK